MHVVNRNLSYMSRQPQAQQGHVGGGVMGTGPHQNVGPPDPWLSHIYARNQYDAQQNAQNNDGSTKNPWLDALRDNINTQIANAKSNALAQKKDALLGFGSKELAMKVLGMGANDPFIQSISDNPDTSFSWLARENFRNRMDTGVTEGNLNAGNLFYSGARGVALQNLARTHLSNVDLESTAIRNQIAQIQRDLLATISGLQGQLIQASQPTAA